MALGSCLCTGVGSFYAVQLIQMLAWAVIAVASVYYINAVMEPEDAVKGQALYTMAYTLGSVLGALLRRSIKKGKPDLNILFQYNMPLRALAKMTNGAISMGMVDGIVMEPSGFLRL